MSAFNPKFTITNRMTAAITQIERARGFLEAARLSDDWVRDMGNKALIKEAHHTTHIEGTRLTLDQAERLWNGEIVPEADPDDTRELLNYRFAFEFVSDCLDSGDPITEGLIREIHRRLVEGVRGGKAGYDFKRLFTISEYYDRDRPTFYKKIQSVRENDMDMTGWLDYFITGLETQMIEVKERGEQVIRRDVLVQKHSLNERQTKALDFLMKNSSVHISEIEELCPGVTRRTLQRDMNGLIELNLVRITGSARQSNYEFIK